LLCSLPAGGIASSCWLAIYMFIFYFIIRHSALSVLYSTLPRRPLPVRIRPKGFCFYTANAARQHHKFS
jgi:hypothetical protein